MNEAVEEFYFNWLCAKVVNPTDFHRSATYFDLLKKLHCTEFVWVVLGDDNRVEDGKELRKEFILQADIPDDPHWRLDLGCSVLEMLIAFARRAEFQDETPAQDWFWEFLDNLNLKEFSDQRGFDEEYVELVLHEFIWRAYPPNGNGSLFPISQLDVDQREVELYYQLCNYLVDQHRVA
jgi:hypothetical protein